MFEKSTSDARPHSDIHRCISGAYCRSFTIIAGERIPTLTAQPKTLCEACLDHFQASVRRLPKDWAMLHATLGHRRAATGDMVRSTPTPGINIDTGGEALMARINETVDRAAAIVAAQLDIEPPDGRRNSTPTLRIAGRNHTPEAGSAAAAAADKVKPTDIETLLAQVRLVERNIEHLAAAATEPALVWRQPRRCDQHHDQITRAETTVAEAKPANRPAAIIQLNTAYRAAGACDDCAGWNQHGQAREIVEYSGLDICIQLAKVHQLARAHLGHTRLRHNYRMPCPATDAHGNTCDAETVGRNDGSAVVDCLTCGACWTDREYKFLVGLVTEGIKEVELNKWLLAEAYWRLDALRTGADKIRTDPLLEAPGSGKFVLEGIDMILAGHPTPQDRKNASDKAGAEQRQEDDDNWTWRNETVYKKPKAKPRKSPAGKGPSIAPSSLSTVVDAAPVTDRRPVCPECREIHAGECA